MKRFWEWLCGLFDKMPAIWRMLYKCAKSQVVSDLNNPEFQAKALELVWSLTSTDLTNEQKAHAFNEAFKEWARTSGKELGTSTVNALRELGVAAYKAEIAR